MHPQGHIKFSAESAVSTIVCQISPFYPPSYAKMQVLFLTFFNQ